MSNFSMFLAENAKPVETVKLVVSNRFVDEEGKPIEWEIRPVSSEKDEAIRRDCTKKVPVAGKRGQFTQEIDTDKYIAKLCVACVTFPNLNEAELQDSYGVNDGEHLMKAMLLSGEYTDLKTKVMEINGYDMSMEELVDEAKN